MGDNTTDLVTWRQDSLRKRYREEPDLAQFVDHARTDSASLDPFHGVVNAGDVRSPLRFGIHRAVGGDHDLANPGDMLCAALAACMDSTLRMMAARLGVELKSLQVEVRASADARGCLMVGREVPAGFSRIDINIHMAATDGSDPARVERLKSTSEQCCVVLRTLRSDVPVETRFSATAANAGAG